jgi:hypothetical protein
MAQMIIANRLTDGLVVFYTGGGWSQAIADGAVLDTAAEQQDGMTSAKQDERHCIVVDPNLIEVEKADDRWKPVAIREAIRAFGPTV